MYYKHFYFSKKSQMGNIVFVKKFSFPIGINHLIISPPLAAFKVYNQFLQSLPSLDWTSRKFGVIQTFSKNPYNRCIAMNHLSAPYKIKQKQQFWSSLFALPYQGDKCIQTEETLLSITFTLNNKSQYLQYYNQYLQFLLVSTPPTRISPPHKQLPSPSIY